MGDNSADNPTVACHEMTAAPIDFAARRRETASAVSREARLPEADQAVRDLLSLRSRWFEGIAFDRRFTDAEMRIAAGAVCRYLNRDPGNARFGMLWMSVWRLAKELGKGERTVTRALKRIRAFGYFELVEPGGGKHRAAVYRLTLPSAAAPYDADTLPPAAPYDADTLPPAAPYDADTLPPAAPDTLPLAAPNPEREDHPEGEEEALASARAARALAREGQRHQSNRRRGERNKGIPSDWRPTEADRRFAIEFGYDSAWVAEAVGWFRDYHLSRGTVLACSSAAWRGFVRHAEDFGPWGTDARGLDIVTVEHEHSPRAAGPLPAPRIDWEALGEAWLSTREWPPEVGGPPNSAECRMPTGLLQKVRHRLIRMAKERTTGDQPSV